MGKLYLLLLPGLTAIAILIPDIMRIFFKPTWLPVADLVRIMAFYGLLIAFLRMGEAILLALAHVCAVFIIYTTTILLTALLLLGGIHYGAAGAAWAVTLGAVPAIWMMYSALRNLQAFDWPLLLSRCQPGITAALLLAISTGLLQWILTPLIGRLAMLSIVALVDGLLFWIVFRYVKKRQHHNQQPIEAI
jgi:O-antigen/teichoic acid export membrane protein